MYLAKASFSLRASDASSPSWTSIPAARNFAKPLPATSGLGSLMAATTRFTPAVISASAHGAVRPVCEQGSRLR